MEKDFTISWDFIIKALILIIAVYFLFLTKDIIIWIIFALVLSILFNFVINFLEKKRIPRIISVILVYISILALIGLFFYKTAPLFLNEIKLFVSSLPTYLEKLSPYFEKLGIDVINKANFLDVLENNLQQASESVLNALVAIFGGVQATVFIVFLAFFFSLEKNLLEKVASNFAPRKYKEYLLNLLPRAKRKVNSWFISRVIGMIFVGVLSYAVFLFLDIKYEHVSPKIEQIIKIIVMNNIVVNIKIDMNIPAKIPVNRP